MSHPPDIFLLFNNLERKKVKLQDRYSCKVSVWNQRGMGGIVCICDNQIQFPDNLSGSQKIIHEPTREKRQYLCWSCSYRLHQFIISVTSNYPFTTEADIPIMGCLWPPGKYCCHLGDSTHFWKGSRKHFFWNTRELMIGGKKIRTYCIITYGNCHFWLWYPFT